jgi:DNA-binding Lrp family transcriptional regulator
MRPLDRIDVGILRALQNDGRRSNKEIAADVGLAPSSCLARTRHLQQAGVLRGIHADVVPPALGVGLHAMVSVVMRDQSAASREAFFDETLARREVVGLTNLAGAVDYLVEVMVRDTAHLRDFVLEAIASRPDVRQYTTNLVFDQARSAQLPCYLELER